MWKFEKKMLIDPMVVQEITIFYNMFYCFVGMLSF